MATTNTNPKTETYGPEFFNNFLDELFAGTALSDAIREVSAEEEAELTTEQKLENLHNSTTDALLQRDKAYVSLWRGVATIVQDSGYRNFDAFLDESADYFLETAEFLREQGEL
jgi:hypothetical protein